MLEIIIGVLIATVAVQLLAGFLPGIEVDDWTSAFWAALMMGITRTAVMYLWGPMGAATAVGAPASYFGVLFVINAAAFGFAAVAIDGVRVRNPFSLLLAGIALTAAGYGVDRVATELGSAATGF